jgi:aminoglycoside phosphotransferase (APT) family kinase protein
VTALEIERPTGKRDRWVVRQYGAADLHADPHIAAHEFQLLQWVQARGVPVPTPHAFDESGTILPSPYGVIEFMEGQTDFAPTDLDATVHQLATHLARIHALPDAEAALGFLPRRAATYRHLVATLPDRLDEGLSEALVRATLESVGDMVPRNPIRLLHGDYWLGNVLWRDGQLVALLDWEDAALGDPLADVANARLELLWALGADAMTRFTRAYEKVAPVDMAQLPLWDLWAALRPAGKLSTWGLDAATEQQMRVRHRWFVEQAIEGY